MSTQQGFGLILNTLGRSESPFADRIVTTSPDVTVSTNLGSWVNRRGLFAREELVDIFRQEKIASSFTWDFTAKGQHIELGIAEMNLFVLLSALGLSHAINGERLLPVGSIYDIFIERGLDALNYACYQDARFMIAGTPAGTTLAPEGGAHQSIKTPLIGLSQPGLASFEPAYVDELATIMAWGFDYMQRDSDLAKARAPSALGDDDKGGAVYLRLSTRTIAQPERDITPRLKQSIIDGAYWFDKPSGNADVLIAYTGTVAPEAIAAAHDIRKHGVSVGILAITSADRLFAGWTRALEARRQNRPAVLSHIEQLMAGLDRKCQIITVLDGHPATLAWLGGVHGHRVVSLGIEKFGETGRISDLYRSNGIDADSISKAARTGPPIQLEKLHP
jgi:pyruvate dehydrogenase E1 component